MYIISSSRLRYPFCNEKDGRFSSILLSDTLVVFYYLSESEIWPNKRRVAFGGSGLIKWEDCTAKRITQINIYKST